jgi:hypothetical protein
MLPPRFFRRIRRIRSNHTFAVRSVSGLRFGRPVFALSSIWKFNSVQFSSVQFSSIQFSSIQFSSVQFNSVQFSSVQFSLPDLFLVAAADLADIAMDLAMDLAAIAMDLAAIATDLAAIATDLVDLADIATNSAADIAATDFASASLSFLKFKFVECQTQRNATTQTKAAYLESSVYPS